MNRDSIDLDEVFHAYAAGLKNQKATYVMPKGMLEHSSYDEVSVAKDLEKIASAPEHANLYDLFGTGKERFMPLQDEAHPEGSPTIVKAPDQLGIVETKEAAHDAIEDVATKKMKLATAVLEFAADLDQAGFVVMAKNLDVAVSNWVGRTVKFAEQAVEEEFDAAKKLDQVITASLHGNHWLLEHYRGSLGDKLKSAVVNPTKLPKVVADYEAVMEHLKGLPELEDSYKLMEQALPTVKELASGNFTQPGAA